MNLQIKNIVSWIIKIGLFIVPFIPLYIAGNLFFPFITGKAFAFRIVVELVFALWLGLALFYKEYRPKKNWLLWAVSAFVVVAFLATIFGVNPLRSFWSNYERMEGFLAYAHLFAYFLVLSTVFKKRDWLVLFNLFVVSGILEGVYAIFQKLGVLSSIQGGFRVDGTIGNPAYLAAYLIFTVFFCAWLFMNSKNVYVKTYFAAAGLFTLVIIYLTASRGPVLGILAGFFLMALAYLIFKKAETDGEKLIKKSVLGAFIVLAVVALSLWCMRNSAFIRSNPVLARLTDLSFQDRTITARFSVWQMSFEAFKERPILGWGPENYIAVFSKYYKPEMWRQEPWFDRSHNIVFDWLINAGLLGLLSYLSMFAAAFYCLFKNYKKRSFSLAESLMIAGVFVAYFFQNLFIFDNIGTYISFFAILAFISGSFSEESREESQRQRPNFLDEAYLPPVLIGLLIIFFVVCYFINIKSLIANSSLLDGLKAVAYSTKEEAFNDFDRSVKMDTYLGINERRSQFANFVLDNITNLKFTDEQKAGILQETLTELNKDAEENPLDPRPLTYLGMFYNKINQFDKAIESYNAALILSPKKQNILAALANTYVNKGDYVNALAILQKSFDLDPSYTTARIDLAGVNILVGKQAEADRLLKEGFGTVDMPDEFLVKVYYKVKNYSRLVDIWKSFVNTWPENVDYRKSLAGAYLLAGQPANAIAALQEIVKIDPSMSAEIERYIEQVKGQ